MSKITLVAGTELEDSFLQPEVSEEEREYIIKMVKQFVTSTMASVTSADPWFSFREIKCSGSTGEGLKVSFPNEFDFLLILDKDVEVRQAEGYPPGFYHLSHQGEQLVSLLPIRNRFYCMLREVLAPEGDNAIPRLKFSSAAVQIDVSPNFQDIPIKCNWSVDLVLTARYDVSPFPPWRQEIANRLIRFLCEGLDQGHHILELDRLPKMELLFVPKYRKMWRCSFSEHEHLLLTNLTEQQKTCYKMLKVILERNLKRPLPSILCKLSTYNLKTVLMTEYWTTRTLSESACLLHLMEKIVQALLSRHMPHFFITSCNLLDQEYDPDHKNGWTNLFDYTFVDHMAQIFKEYADNLDDRFPELRKKIAVRESQIFAIADPPS